MIKWSTKTDEIEDNYSSAPPTNDHRFQIHRLANSCCQPELLMSMNQVQLPALNKASHVTSSMAYLYPQLVNLCKSAKYARQQVGVLYPKSFIPLITLATVPGWECSSLDILRCAPKTGVLDMSLCFDSVMQPPHPCQQKRHIAIHYVPETASCS